MNSFDDGGKVALVIGCAIGLVFGLIFGLLIPRGEAKQESNTRNAQTQTRIVCKREGQLAPAVFIHEVEGGVQAECVLQQ